jgi:hypothetical protein
LVASAGLTVFFPVLRWVLNGYAFEVGVHMPAAAQQLGTNTHTAAELSEASQSDF